MHNITLRRSGAGGAVASGAFISHTGRDGSFAVVTQGLKANNIAFIGDSQIDAGVDFHATLRQMLRAASLGIVLLSDDVFASIWVRYEVGMLEGMRKGIVLYCDPARRALRDTIPEFLRCYEVIDEVRSLQALVHRSSVAGKLFKHEVPDFGVEDFQAALANKQEHVELTLALDGLDAEDSAATRFGLLVIRLARSGTYADDARVCQVTTETRTEGRCVMNEGSDTRCALLTEVSSRHAPETVALNSVLFAAQASEGKVVYTVPLHTSYGTTFKCFVDILEKTRCGRIERVLRDAGMEDVSYSESGESQRFYFRLPQSKDDGLLHLWTPEGISNNFLCPGSSLL